METKTLIYAASVISILISSLLLVYYTVDAYEYLFIQNIFQPETSNLEGSFYSTSLNSTKTKIFLVGSSQVWRLNMTYLIEETSKFCPNCEIYNLGVAGDKPNNRIKTLNPLIELRPDLVIYGVGYPDFAFWKIIEKSPLMGIGTPDPILPNPKILFENSIFSNFPNTVNPKYFSLNVIKNLFENKNFEDEFILDPTHRVFKADKDFDEEDYLAYNNEELNQYEEFHQWIDQTSKLDPDIYSKNAFTLKKIIERLQNNDIKVIVFTTPTPEVILEKISLSDQKIFISTFEEISEDYNLKTYFLHEKYSDKKIWSDPIHVTLGPEGMIYTKEMLEIIKNDVDEL